MDYREVKTPMTKQEAEEKLRVQTEKKEALGYNTSMEPLKLPEYGRMVMQMVEHAMSIEDKAQRTAYAHRIIQVMSGLNPQMKYVPDYQLKLWDHLAFLSDYQLDVDYPVEIQRFNRGEALHKLSYPGHRIKLRHYGHLVEAMLKELMENPEKAQQQDLVARVALYMRRLLSEGKADRTVNDKIAHDIAFYTEGQVSVEEVLAVFNRQNSYPQGRWNRRRY